MFGPALAFLDDLQAHNDKPWFDANRQRYEREVRDPAVAFVEAMAPRLARLSPHLRAIAKGAGSAISRMNRDTRFSADKSPYEDWIGFHFSHDAGKEAPGCHLHLSRADTGVGIGKEFPADHPFGEDLRRKTFGAGRPVDPTLPLPALCAAVEAGFRDGWPLMVFLCDSLALSL
jgi:uncharacterized protein (DUF2461 family)